MMGLQCRRSSRTMLIVVVSTLIAILACSTSVYAGCCCPTFWIAYGSHCYRFFSYEKTWNEAETFCQSYTVPSLGSGPANRDSLAHLVSVHSEEEHNFVKTLLESSRKKGGADPGLWLGLHDFSSEGHFKWSDGSAVDFTDWAPLQPDAYTENEDCVILRSNSSKWWDGPCVMDREKLVHYFICKTPMW